MSDVEKKIEEILYSDDGVPEMWAGSRESIPEDKRIKRFKELLDSERERAVRGFAKWVDGDSKKLLSRYNYFIDMATQYLSKGKDKE